MDHGTEEMEELFLTVRWQMNRFCDRVDDPAKDSLLGGPEAISLEKFLLGNWFLAVMVEIIIASKHFINCVVSVSSYTKGVNNTLGQLDKVIEVYIHVSNLYSDGSCFLQSEAIVRLRLVQRNRC